MVLLKCSSDPICEPRKSCCALPFWPTYRFFASNVPHPPPPMTLSPPPPPSIQMRLMSPPNATWQQILLQARANPEVLKQPEVSSRIGSRYRSGSISTEDLFTTPPQPCLGDQEHPERDPDQRVCLHVPGTALHHAVQRHLPGHAPGAHQQLGKVGGRHAERGGDGRECTSWGMWGKEGKEKGVMMQTYNSLFNLHMFHTCVAGVQAVQRTD